MEVQRTQWSSPGRERRTEPMIRSYLRKTVSTTLPRAYRVAYNSKRAFCESDMVTGYRALKNAKRLEPSFFIVGAQKAGTTFLHRLLTMHPQVVGPILKEVDFFGRPGKHDVERYKSFFPLAPVDGGKKIITGESTPHYMFYPHSASQIAEHFPDAKIIAVLREPAGRALSHYRMNVDRRVEKLSFAEAIDKEDERLAGEWERSMQDPEYLGLNFAEFSYKKRGMYLEQILRLEALFPKENILVVNSNVLFKETDTALIETERFLGIDEWKPAFYAPENVAKAKDTSDKDSVQALKESFKPMNRELFEYLKWEGSW
jgi:hypothetical protein